MKVQNVFTNEYKLADAIFDERINHIPLQEHDVVVDGIIPLADQFNHCKMMLVVGKKNFQVKSWRAECIPLRMNIEVVDRVGEFKFTVASAIERRPLILFTYVSITPVVIWFYIVHLLTPSK